ncbi:uncharacterized protein LOC107809340 isoform X1 [Nicotiana tabacum]|uniref:Uncharacterized protein n=2 Tax=Nicotiana tabacum TaxID=4097 RepID=A0A1S4BKS6_TOBAC|nr:PREDICTED: putative uncharacterized protein YIL169C isoform X1 [Nicotiana tabacum]XP_016489437.1 PREDICTED: putative uncharacterized protein YIL169C isoform X1 [Nicotiana tabacum]XP_016489443.1 PREDICTED: putative uncharacterized protein YIL169C isoform X1 [Nicotiana tabacum]
MEKIRSKSWIGNIYHKFEAVCQEVDGFVTKDTVKYVENQVQTVGASMKKLYSGVVQDFHIPIDDHIKRETQAVNGKQKYDVGTYTSSVAGTTQNPIKEQSSVDQYADNSPESHNASTSTELGVVASEEGEIEFSVGNDRAAATCKSSRKVSEENITREEELVDEESSTSVATISSESCSDKDSKDTKSGSFSDDDNCFSDVSSSLMIILQDDIVREEQPLAEGSSSFLDNLSESQSSASEKNEKMFDSSPDAINCISTAPSSQIVLQRNITSEVQPITAQSNSFGDIALSKSLPSLMEESHGNSITAKFPHPTSFYDTELGTFPEDERGCNRFFDAAESISNVSITHTILQDNITSEDQLAPKKSSSIRDKSLPQTPAFTSNIPPTSLSDAGFGVSMPVCKSFLDDITCVSDKSSKGAFEDAPNTFQSSELVLSRVLVENESVDVDTGVSDSSPLTEFSSLSIGNCSLEAESDCSISTGLSSSLSTPLASANNVVAVIPALSSAAALLMDFSDVNVSSSHESVGDSGSIRNNLEWYPSSQLKALMCPAEIGCLNDCCIDLPGMETIDLTDKGKQESCVLVDNKLQRTVSFRPRKYKSYKELIQEAFASRKRLIKEYKQLAVLYADVDAETSKHTELPSLPSPCLHSTESSISESGWELL